MSANSLGRQPRRGLPTGQDLLRDPLLNKGTGFPADEREALGLVGAGTQPQSTTPTLGQVAQGAAAGVGGVLAAQGVPGAAAVAGAIANPPVTKSGLKEGSKLLASSVNKTSKALGVSSEEYNVFKQSVANIESRGGEYGITGGAGNHYQGAYQMGEAAKKDAARILGIPVPSRQEFLANPQLQEKMFDAFTANNHKWLSQHNEKYAKMSPQEQMKVLGYAHNQGMGGADKWLKTGVVGQDAFGTKADKYAKEIDKNMTAFKGGGSAATKPTVTTAPSVNQTATQTATRVPVEPGKIDYTRSTSTKSLDNTLEELGLTPEMVARASEGLGLGSKSVDDLLTDAGEGLSSLLHQDEAYGEKAVFSTAQRGAGGRAGKETKRENSQFGGQVSPNPIIQNTVSGIVPKTSNISTPALDALKASGGDLLNSAGNAANGFLSSLTSGKSVLSSMANPVVGTMLENIGFSDKRGEMQASASTQMAMNAQTSGKRPSEVRASPERGSHLMEGQSAPIEVRNPESSIRRFTDMLIAYTFG